MVFSCVSETSNLAVMLRPTEAANPPDIVLFTVQYLHCELCSHFPQSGYTHGTAPVPTALPPAHPVSCAKRHFHERIIFCNRGVRIIHYLQTLLWQTQTSAPILHGQQDDSPNHLRR